MRTKLVGAFALLMSFSTNTLATDQVKTYLTGKLSEATLAHENQLERCEAKLTTQEPVRLPVAKLSEAEITLQELHSALFHFRDQAEQACLDNSRLKLISAILDLNSYLSDNPNAPIDPIQSGLALVIPSPQQLEARAFYSQLSANKVELLDSIFSGKSPTIANISNWQEAARLLRKNQTFNAEKQVTEILR